MSASIIGGERGAFAVLLSAPFRLFFLIAAVDAVLVLALGHVLLPPDAAAVWHAHELLFGYVPAVQTGILLTATAIWTGRRPIVGAPLLALLVLWIGGRMSIAVFGLGSMAAAVTTAYPAVLASLLVRELVAGRRYDQLPTVVVLVGMVIAVPLFHAEVALTGGSVFSIRLTIAAIMAQFMILLGGIIPGFTRDYLAPRGGRQPVGPGRIDLVAIGVGLPALGMWVALPAFAAPPLAGGLLIAAGILHLARQARWRPWRTFGEPLVFVLHVGYGALPLGFVVAGLAVIFSLPRLAEATIHVWAIGGTGLMTLALMTRASLGHTGRPPRALAGTSVLYGAVTTALLLHVGGILAPPWATLLMPMAGLCWMLAYGGFLAIYGALLIEPGATPHP